MARYLVEVGSAERKLEYSRQILCANPHFTLDAVFNLGASHPRTTIGKQDFLGIIKALQVPCTPQEQ